MPPLTTFQLSMQLFLQLAVILIACRIVGMIAKYLGQPQVVAEMIAGVILGPSILGLIFPDFGSLLFPKQSLPILFAVSQVGLSLYMFLIGVEFRSDQFIQQGKTAATVSIAGMITPFILGSIVAIGLHRTGGLFPERVQLYQAMIFMGAAMCITAFPMLARIIVENGLAGTALGTLALAAGAIDDVAAWCLLAIVLSSRSNNWNTALFAIGGGIVYATFVLTALRMLLQRLKVYVDDKQEVAQGITAFILALVMLGSYITDYIGIYAVFGAFLIGCAVPRGLIADKIREQIEPLTVALLLPLFFTYSGLNTRLDLVTTPWLIFIALIVLIASSVGKGVACWAAARWCGSSQGTSIAVGALMNARGLMELILLNLAREGGLIGPELFSILVVMAIVTTLAATPVFRWVQSRYDL